jgi:hypothetical protein
MTARLGRRIGHAEEPIVDSSTGQNEETKTVAAAPVDQ